MLLCRTMGLCSFGRVGLKDVVAAFLVPLPFLPEIFLKLVRFASNAVM